VTIGPLIDIGALEKIESIVLDATLQGASVLAGGHRHDLGGSFYAPTVLGDVTPSMACMTTEIFGPVAPLVRFSTEEQALAMANDTRSGLAGYFYSRDLNRVWRARMRYGWDQYRPGLL
jgi:succinate-semialdehyde dehydrogenase/glutarate-semialdehyde dehydrogenase